MPKLTKYERVRVVGARATQIASGAPPTIDITGMTDALEIAEAELEQRKIPMMIIRSYPDGREEKIAIADMEV